MDIAKETEIILRDNRYTTWQWSDSDFPLICFEDESIIGFVYVLQNCEELITKWSIYQDTVLRRFNPELKKAGDKAWNVYSIFLTDNEAERSIKDKLINIEENFQLTRKIARSGINSKGQLVGSLMPLLSILNRPMFDQANFEGRLQDNLSALHENGAKAFLKDVNIRDIAQILSEP